MTVSIIIPCKNEEDNILNTINNLENKLSNINFEIIIIDDYSTDSTAKKIQKASIEKQFLKYFHNDKKGLGGAINLGIKKSKEEFVDLVSIIHTKPYFEYICDKMYKTFKSKGMRKKFDQSKI